MLFSPLCSSSPCSEQRAPRRLGQRLSLRWKSRVCLVGLGGPAAAVRRKEQNPSGLAAVPPLSSLSQPV